MKPFLIITLFFALLAPKVDISLTESADDVCLNAEEKRLYEMIMQYRKEKKLPPIPISAKLTMVAKAHAVDLMEHYDFDPANECNPHSWSEHGSWTSCCYTSDHKAAECMWAKPKEIADYPGSGYEIAYYSSGDATASEGIDGWKKSPGHNPLLINSGIWEKIKWQGIGIAIYKNYGLVWFGDQPDSVVPKVCN